MSKKKKPLTWAVQHRMDFITRHLQANGQINRGDVIKAYNISMPQASTDLQRWQELNPGQLLYDTKAKTYRLKKWKQPEGEQHG